MPVKLRYKLLVLAFPLPNLDCKDVLVIVNCGQLNGDTELLGWRGADAVLRLVEVVGPGLPDEGDEEIGHQQDEQEETREDDDGNLCEEVIHLFLPGDEAVASSRVVGDLDHDLFFLNPAPFCCSGAAAHVVE